MCFLFFVLFVAFSLKLLRFPIAPHPFLLIYLYPLTVKVTKEYQCMYFISSFSGKNQVIRKDNVKFEPEKFISDAKLF